MSKTDNELFELCSEVYRRTKWDELDLLKTRYFIERDDHGEQIPVYTSDYILEKMPFGNKKSNIYCQLSVIRYLPDNYGALWKPENEEDGLLEVSDTPVKALLKLVIALTDAGELS